MQGPMGKLVQGKINSVTVYKTWIWKYKEIFCHLMQL